MYLSILEFSTGRVEIIYDEDDLLLNTPWNTVEKILYILGHDCQSTTTYMITKENPYDSEPWYYEKLDDIINDLDEKDIKRINELLSNDK